MRKVIVIGVFCVSTICLGQSSVLHNLNNNRLMSNALNKIGNIELNDNDFTGSPFLEKNFLPSTIKGEQGTHFLRYNIYNDEIILQRDNEYFKIPKENLKYFVINNKYTIRLIDGTYYVQISQLKNNYSIVKKEKIKFVQGRVSDNGYSQNTQAKFTNLKPEYYLYNESSDKIIAFNKNELKNVFPDKSLLIDEFFKKNKLKDEDDYGKFLELL